jgi:hypothetical protein
VVVREVKLTLYEEVVSSHGTLVSLASNSAHESMKDMVFLSKILPGYPDYLALGI